MTEPLSPGATIGILGGGQLGRMLALAASELGFRCHILAPTGDNPAFDVAARYTEAAYDDVDQVAEFAHSVDVVTYEFENIPVAAVEDIAAIRNVRPGPRALQVSQDRLDEKKFLQSLDIPVAPFCSVATDEDWARAVSQVGPQGILKTRRLGYDGKGQVRIAMDPGAGATMPQDLSGPLVYEQLIRFDREISVILARSLSGECRAFPCAENRHEAGILKHSTVPAHVCPLTATAAVKSAIAIADALDYCGVLAVEYFVCEPEDGGVDQLYVNEIAPRVHNSGHWTQDGCDTSQFEQHIRAITGWPLGPVRRHSDVEMINLLGQDVDQIDDLRGQANTKIHLYGKSGWKRDRKMGHANLISTKT